MFIRFAIENSAPVEVHMLAWQTRLPVASIAIGGYILGMVSGTAIWGFIQTALRKVKEIGETKRH
jgi:uncharacterized integral membrane protein